MSDPPRRPDPDGTGGDIERELREMNDALLVSSVRQHELAEQARNAEADLRESEHRYRTIIDQVKDYAIFSTDPEGRATTWNQGVERVLGFDEYDFLGQDVTEAIFTPEDVENGVPQRELDEAAANGAAGDDRWMCRKDGSRFFAAGVTTALKDGSGRLVGFTKVMRDQTEQAQTAETLRKFAAELAESDRRKNEFLATLAHELRNPLAPIRMGLEVMRTAKDDPALTNEMLDTMERQVTQMVRLIDDLLEVSRITQGKLELRKAHVDLADVMQSAVEAVRPFIDEAGHELTVAPPPRPILLDADPSRLAQVFSNLLNNSAKYTREGGRIWLTAERQGGEAVVTVKDTGLGIPADMLDHVFDMFTQLDRSIERGYTGLGIGLTLVKRLVEMHDGTIVVRSEGAGKGSEFIVRLPALVEPPADETPSVPDETTARTARLRIMVVDDNKAAADMLGLVVKMLGHEIRTAYDGLQGIAAAAEFRPDVVLMDLGMPKIDGYEAARRIREQAWGADMVLVALTGWGQDEDRRRTKEAGFDHHLVKPADPAALQALFAGLKPAP